jgi:prepilin-type N-terminal cleavage/methylation domain-containing protein
MAQYKQAGFTIVELIVTIVLIGLLVPAITMTITTLNLINDRARDLASVHALAENKVESLRSVSFTGLANGTTTFTNELPASLATPRSATYTISAASPALKQVDVSISYNDHGQNRSISYRTYIGELGVGQY